MSRGEVAATPSRLAPVPVSGGPRLVPVLLAGAVVVVHVVLPLFCRGGQRLCRRCRAWAVAETFQCRGGHSPIGGRHVAIPLGVVVARCHERCGAGVCPIGREGDSYQLSALHAHAAEAVARTALAVTLKGWSRAKGWSQPGMVEMGTIAEKAHAWCHQAAATAVCGAVPGSRVNLL